MVLAYQDGHVAVIVANFVRSYGEALVPETRNRS